MAYTPCQGDEAEAEKRQTAGFGHPQRGCIEVYIVKIYLQVRDGSEPTRRHVEIDEPDAEGLAEFRIRGPGFEYDLLGEKLTLEDHERIQVLCDDIATGKQIDPVTGEPAQIEELAALCVS